MLLSEAADPLLRRTVLSAAEQIERIVIGLVCKWTIGVGAEAPAHLLPIRQGPDGERRGQVVMPRAVRYPCSHINTAIAQAIGEVVVVVVPRDHAIEIFRVDLALMATCRLVGREQW
jgi:hypothetical protein